ncbi:MOG protein, partial [Crypturellus soui]|nr:MOG protein [Crypturellus soui]
ERGEKYGGRTELSSSGLNHGNMSLLLRNVRNSDRGEYVCSLATAGWEDESVVELEVTG